MRERGACGGRKPERTSISKSAPARVDVSGREERDGAVVAADGAVGRGPALERNRAMSSRPSDEGAGDVDRRDEDARDGDDGPASADC